MAIIAGERLKLVSRNGYDRAELFREPFRALATAGVPAMAFDGEIAVPDERGVTHLDALSEAIRAPAGAPRLFRVRLVAPRRRRPAALRD